MRIPVSVSKPSGEGPFPAIVVMHDCSGLGPHSSGAARRWAGTLAERGYVVVIPDSFSTRGYPNGVCSEGTRGRIDVSPDRRAQDAIDAAAYARTLRYVDGRRIGVMGGSHGGTTTLVTLGRADSGFRAGIALYPRCSTVAAGYAPSAPLLILIGELDDWTPAADCRSLVQRTPSIALQIYPGAHHSFDSPYAVRFVATRINPSVPGGRGATTGGNAQAWSDAERRAVAFFAGQLR